MKWRNHSCHLLMLVDYAQVAIFNVANVSFNTIRKNKISYSGKFPNLQKISKFTVCSSAAYIANIMNPDQTAPKGAI